MYSMQAVFFKCLIECCLSVFVRLICTLYSCVLSTFDCMLSVCFCHVYVYYIQLCVVNLSLYVVCIFCQVNMYSMQLCAVNLWFYVVRGILSRLYLFYTAVWCQFLIVFCLCSFVMSICILYSCVLSTFDCMLYVCCCMFICIQYNCVLSTFVCVFLLICNLYNELYVLMLIIILYYISLVLNHLLKPIEFVNNESAYIPYVHHLYLETIKWNKRVRLEALLMTI